jgi:magnesium chelatase family protein
MNPCPCGFASDPEKSCICTPAQMVNYRKKISGPILDRIDLHIEVPRVKFEKLSSQSDSENSKTIKQRVEKARQQQTKRFKEIPFITNSEMTSETVKQFCPLDDISKALLKNAVEQMHLSARAYFRILKLARTIADLSGEDNVLTPHIAEALQYRPKIE